MGTVAQTVGGDKLSPSDRPSWYAFRFLALVAFQRQQGDALSQPAQAHLESRIRTIAGQLIGDTL